MYDILERFKNMCFSTTYFHVWEELRFLNISLLFHKERRWFSMEDRLSTTWRFSWLNQVAWLAGRNVSKPRKGRNHYFAYWCTPFT